MNRIYRQAEMVLIWLGQLDAFTREGFAAMKQLGEAYEATKYLPRESLSVAVANPFDSPLFKKMGLPDITFRQWQGCLSLYRRTWFYRSWTVQEIALAGPTAIVCGGLISSWGSWAMASRFFVNTEWALPGLSLGRLQGETNEDYRWRNLQLGKYAE